MQQKFLTAAIRKSLMLGVVTTGFYGPQAWAQDGDDSVEEQGKITVTGSRIKRSDIEGAVPVTVITREDLELSGESNAADFLRNTTFNTAGSFRPQSGSSIQSVSTLSLRGIGSARTLVLIDGRRIPKAPTSGQAQDLNAIPLGAIERIEILTDGASAIYGSDAIGGVVNIITRQDYQGAEIMLGAQEVSIPANGGEREEGSVLFGAAGDRSSIIAGISWNDREIIFERDFPWYVPGGSTFSNNFRDVAAAGNETGPFISATACNFPNTGFYTLNPGAGVAGGERCAYDFNLEAANEASIENQSFYVKARHEINDNWELWVNAGLYETKSFGRYAPVPDGSAFSGTGAPLSADSPNNPSNPASPLYDPANWPAPQAVHWRHRFDALGNRDNNITTTNTSFEIGTTGQVGRAEVEFGLSRANSNSVNIGRNYLLRSAAAAAVEDGSYNLANPYGSSPMVLNSLRVTTNRDAKFDQDALFGSVAFDLFDMANGPVSVYVGAEYRDVKYSDRYDSLSEAGQVGGSSGSSAGGGRDVTSIFFEGLVPILDNLEMSLAGRYDDYSDYGNDFSPKVSFRYQPLDNLTLRASYGEGFRAPTLDILTAQPASSADTVNDPRTCIAEGSPSTCLTQITGLVIANPNLASEQSEQFSLGLAYEPFDWLNFTVDYWNIEITDQIRNITAQTLVNEDNLMNFGRQPLGCTRDAATGAILLCTRGAVNEGLINASGVDINARFRYQALAGSFSHQFQWSRALSQKLDKNRELVDDPGLPANRIIINNSYTYGDWQFAYNMNIVGDQFNNISSFNTSAAADAYIAGLAAGTDVDREVGRDGLTYVKDGHNPHWITHDFQVNYFAPWNGRFTLGVQNAGEKFPPIGLGNTTNRAYDFNLYHGYGRITYFRYTQTF